jgi:hypothetical protein
MKTTITQHLVIALTCYLLLAFEIIRFASILTHPYMMFLIAILSISGGYNLTMAFLKKFSK